jgi:hypothetical protein
MGQLGLEPLQVARRPTGGVSDEDGPLAERSGQLITRPFLRAWIRVKFTFPIVIALAFFPDDRLTSLGIK